MLKYEHETYYVLKADIGKVLCFEDSEDTFEELTVPINFDFEIVIEKDK